MRSTFELAQNEHVHAMTDVTGFGLLGHAMEMARGSGLCINIRANDVPLLAQAERLAQEGCVTGASHRNWASYGSDATLPADCPDWKRHVLTDPQTSGGLLVACTPESASTLVDSVKNAGYPAARVIGRAKTGTPGINVTG